jgi:hypothetical protein
MKRLLLILILIFSFQSLTKADDIRDFQIEGMSIGDSVLDYFQKKDIQKWLYSASKTFAYSSHDSNKFKTYESVVFHYKTVDKNYIIHALDGRISYANNIKECYDNEKNILSELENIFPSAKKDFQGKLKHPSDTSGKSIYSYSAFYLDNGTIGIECTDWSNEITSKKGWRDSMRVFIETSEFTKWIRTEAR